MMTNSQFVCELDKIAIKILYQHIFMLIFKKVKLGPRLKSGLDLQFNLSVRFSNSFLCYTAIIQSLFINLYDCNVAKSLIFLFSIKFPASRTNLKRAGLSLKSRITFFNSMGMSVFISFSFLFLILQCEPSNNNNKAKNRFSMHNVRPSRKIILCPKSLYLLR